MTEWLGQKTAAGDRARKGRAKVSVHTKRELGRHEHIWVWLLRLILPLVLGLCSQLISWIWFNNVYGPNAWSIAGGVILAVVAVPIALWAWHSWLPLEHET